MTTNAAVALTANWTDTNLSPTLTNSSNLAVFNNANNGWCYGNYWYPYYYPIQTTIYTSLPPRPIRLTMSEVERLRVAAKKDKALKSTLEKFTDHIEVVVDFPE